MSTFGQPPSPLRADVFYGRPLETLLKALSGIAAETASILDDVQTEFTMEHLETIQLVDETLKFLPGGPQLKGSNANSDELPTEQ
jgi:hypothetical protein